MNKNDFISVFRKKLDLIKENDNTKKTLIYELERAFRNQHFKNIEDINYKKLHKHIEGLKSRKSSNNLKNALRIFGQEFPNFDYDTARDVIREANKKKNNRKLHKKDEVKLSTVIKKIARIDNKKLQLGYMTMMYAGLRISEVSRLKKKDVNFENGLSIFMRESKHNKSRTAKKHIMQNKYYLQQLQDYINTFKDDEENLFYSISNMSKQATKYNFESHDLRAAFSQYIYDSYDEKEEAIKATQEALGHEYDSTTYKKYLNRKINKSGTKFYV